MIDSNAKLQIVGKVFPMVISKPLFGFLDAIVAPPRFFLVELIRK
jgi:hypothetical protein